MTLWLIRPTARIGDPRWLDHRVWTEVIVRASTAATARVIASNLERDPTAPPTGNESLSFRSGFEDEKLYEVVALSDREAEAFGVVEGPDQVIRTRGPIEPRDRVEADKRGG